jgi:hypothetical protein
MRAGSLRRRHVIGSTLLIAVGLVSLGTVGSAPTPAGATAGSAPVCSATPSSPAMGAYAGPASPAGLASFAAQTGTRLTLAADYLPANAGFAGMSNAQSLSWLTGPWQGSGCQLVLGVPMIPTNAGGAPAGTLADGAAGAYNSTFTTLAQTLVSAGFGNAILRLGWEFDGGWYPWSVTNNTEAAEFASYWRQIVTTMRAVPGADFGFDWNLSGGWISWDIDDAYPGNAYVDYIGLDRYDQTWQTPQTPQVAWNDLATMPDGLNWLASFGAANGKPLTIPEWGVAIRSDGHGLGDDPYFVNQMASWIASNNVAFTSYFNFDQVPSQYDAITDGQFPDALSVFKADFGVSAGSAPSAPPPPPPTTTTAPAPVPTSTPVPVTTPVPAAVGSSGQPAGAVSAAPSAPALDFAQLVAGFRWPWTGTASHGPTTSSNGPLTLAQMMAGFRWPWTRATALLWWPPGVTSSTRLVNFTTLEAGFRWPWNR